MAKYLQLYGALQQNPNMFIKTTIDLKHCRYDKQIGKTIKNSLGKYA